MMLCSEMQMYFFANVPIRNGENGALGGIPAEVQCN